MADNADVIIVGAGLAGLVAAAELADAGNKTIIIDQEPEQSLGGIFLVDSLMVRGAGRHVSRRLHFFRPQRRPGRVTRAGVEPSPDPFAPPQSRHRVDDPGKARARTTDRVPGSEITMHQPRLFEPVGVAVCRDDAVAIGLAV